MTATAVSALRATSFLKTVLVSLSPYLQRAVLGDAPERAARSVADTPSSPSGRRALNDPSRNLTGEPEGSRST